MKKIHLLVATITIFVFLLSGIYMRTQFPALYAGNETTRMMFRANHIYILFIGLCNLLLGRYLVTYQKKAYYLQLVSSAIIFIATVLSIIAFFFEAGKGQMGRSFSSIAIILTTFGVLGHSLASARQEAKNEE